jgi:hypothetical protein
MQCIQVVVEFAHAQLVFDAFFFKVFDMLVRLLQLDAVLIGLLLGVRQIVFDFGFFVFETLFEFL